MINQPTRTIGRTFVLAAVAASVIAMFPVVSQAGIRVVIAPGGGYVAPPPPEAPPVYGYPEYSPAYGPEYVPDYYGPPHRHYDRGNHNHGHGAHDGHHR